MNKFKYKALHRISEIINILFSSDCQDVEGMTIKTLSEMLDVPVRIIQEDIKCLVFNEQFDTLVFADDELNDGSITKNELIKRIDSGKLDDVPIEIAFSGFDSECTYISLTELELSCLNSFIEEKKYKSKSIQRKFELKPMYNKSKLKIQDKVYEMLCWIENGESVQMKYITQDKKLLDITIKPLRVVANVEDGIYYVVTIQNGRLVPYRMDRIRRVESSNTKIEIENTSLLNQLDIMWGMEVDGSGPVHVKVMIMDEARVQEKVRRDLSHRIAKRPDCLYEKEGILYYEDEVIGINSFRNWVNSYGSSMLVVEPKSLRDKIIESAKKRIEYYQNQS